MKKVLGIGNALVDILIRIDDDGVLKRLGLSKNSMTLVSKEHVTAILAETQSFPRAQASGGSAANTINGLSRLGGPAGYIGTIGNDAYGSFFQSEMERFDIRTALFTGQQETGKSVVLITPDSERTFATFLGASVELGAGDLTPALFSGYDYCLLEGYLSLNHDLVDKSVDLAGQAKNRIALDLSSYNVVEANRDFLHSLVKKHIDILFANEDEARAFTGKTEPRAALADMARFVSLAVVKIGAHGSLIQAGQEFYAIPALEASAIDTTGAGDLYQAGFFFGLSNDFPLPLCGELGSILAGKVVEIIGARMADEKWQEVRHLTQKAIAAYSSLS